MLNLLRKLRLLLTAILEAEDGLVVAFGLVCSSFISISMGTTKRSYFLPEGDPTSSKSAEKGNLLANRIGLTVLRVSWKVLYCCSNPSVNLLVPKRGQDISRHSPGDGEEGGVCTRAAFFECCLSIALFASPLSTHKSFSNSNHVDYRGWWSVMYILYIYIYYYRFEGMDLFTNLLILPLKIWGFQAELLDERLRIQNAEAHHLME